VEQVWTAILQAVRQRNPTTEAALRTQCKPVEVTGDQVVVTFPFPFLREKLVAPQRQSEIQDALAEVLKVNCRIKLVNAEEYVPDPAANPAPPPSMPAEPQPAERVADALPDEQQVAKELARWAKEHGGQVTIVPPES
jgi:hypothetical protein